VKSCQCVSFAVALLKIMFVNLLFPKKKRVLEGQSYPMQTNLECILRPLFNKSVVTSYVDGISICISVYCLCLVMALGLVVGCDMQFLSSLNIVNERNIQLYMYVAHAHIFYNLKIIPLI